MDIVSRATRSRMMSGIRGLNTKPEIVVRRFLHREGFRFRLHVRDLPGKPDIVLPKLRTAVFVHGCFWHQHAGCRFAYMPKTNREFWSAKLQSNVDRDALQQRTLEEMGWRVVVFWECETTDTSKLAGLADLLRVGEG